MLDVRRLRLLRELKLRGTLAEVAVALNLSPSAVSQQLAQLENEVGVVLLRKVGRRVQLTPQAEILIGHTAVVLDRLELAESEMTASLATATGLVRTAVFQTAALALMPTALSFLSSEYPQLRVEMTQREPETALYETWARDFDLVVAEEYPGHAAAHFPELDRTLLTTDAIRLAVPQARGRSVRSIEDAGGLSWVMEPRGAASRHWAEQRCRQAGFEPDVRFETADLQAHVRLVESGNAVALLPDLVWIGRDITVALIDLPDDPHRNIVTAARKSSANTPAIVACRKSLEMAALGLRTAAILAQGTGLRKER
jgi:DNA-binding transcriptional LysR family regulator